MLEIIHIHKLMKILLDYKSEVSKLWPGAISDLLPIFVYFVCLPGFFGLYFSDMSLSIYFKFFVHLGFEYVYEIPYY